VKVIKNYDTLIEVELLEINGVDTYPRYTGSIVTANEIKNNDVIEISKAVPLEMLVQEVYEQNGIYYGELMQYMGFPSKFDKGRKYDPNTEYQKIISDIFNEEVYFVRPVIGKVEESYNIPAGGSRWEVLNALSKEFGFTAEWNKEQRVYFVKPVESFPIRSIEDRGYISVSSKPVYNHANVYNKKNEIVDIYTEEYFKIGEHSMTPVEVNGSYDRANMIEYGKRLLRLERQDKLLITGIFDMEEVPEMVNEIGKVWDWDSVYCRVRTLSIKNGAFVVVAGQENEEFILMDVGELEDLRGMPRVWI